MWSVGMLCVGNSRGASGGLRMTYGCWEGPLGNLGDICASMVVVLGSEGISWAQSIPGICGCIRGFLGFVGDVSVIIQILQGDIWGAMGVSWSLWGPLRAPLGFSGEPKDLGGTSGFCKNIEGIVALCGILGDV